MLNCAMKICVTGGRDYGVLPASVDGMGRSRARSVVEREFKIAEAQRARLGSVLDAFHSANPITQLLEGGARGADRLAREWAQSHGVPVRTFAADWHAHGRAAGPLRNRRMIIEGEPEVVIAFPGGRGTANLVGVAREHGIEVLAIDSEATS